MRISAEKRLKRKFCVLHTLIEAKPLINNYKHYTQTSVGPVQICVKSAVAYFTEIIKLDSFTHLISTTHSEKHSVMYLDNDI